VVHLDRRGDAPSLTSPGTGRISGPTAPVPADPPIAEAGRLLIRAGELPQARLPPMSSDREPPSD